MHFSVAQMCINSRKKYQITSVLLFIFILKLRGHNSEWSSNTNLCTNNLYILVLSKCVSIQEKNIKQQVFC